jgi:hypothetical protein
MKATFKLTIAIIAGLILVQCTPTETIPLSNIKYHKEYITNNTEGPNKLKTFKKYESYLLDDEIGDSIGNSPYIYYHLGKLEEDDKYLNEGIKKFPDDPYLNYSVAIDESDRNIQDSLYLSILKKHPRFDLVFSNYINKNFEKINHEERFDVYDGKYNIYDEESFITINYNEVNHLYDLVNKFENGTNNSKFYDFEQINPSGLDSLTLTKLNSNIKYIKEKHSFLQNRKPKPWDNDKLSLKSRILLFVENQLKNDNKWKYKAYKDSIPGYFLKQGKEPVTIKLSEMHSVDNYNGSLEWINYGFNSFNPDRNKNGVIDGTTYESDGTVKDIPFEFEVKIEFGLNSQFKNQKCFENFNSLGYITVWMTIDVNNPNKILWWNFGYVQDLADHNLGDYFELKEMFNKSYQRYSMNDYMIRNEGTKKININKTLKYWKTKSEFIKWFKSNTNPSNTEMNNCLGVRFD